MRLLFAISIACFCAVLWAVLATMRRIRLNKRISARRARSASAWEFFEAGESRTPRTLRLTQDLSLLRQLSPISELDHQPFERSKQPAPADLPPRPVLLFSADSHRSSPTPIQDFKAQDARSTNDAGPTLTPKKSQVAQIDIAAAGLSKRRKLINHSALRRIDLSRYGTQGSGDLTDPYTHPLRGSGIQGASLRSI
jgi:hypothetical protein